MFEIIHATDMVNNLTLPNIVKKCIDSEIASLCIVGSGPEGVVVADQKICIFAAGLAPAAFRCTEGGDFDDFAPVEVDMCQFEPSTDDAAVTEQSFNLTRCRTGGDVVVFRGPIQQQVTDAASDQVGLMVIAGQSPDNFDRIDVELVFRKNPIDCTAGVCLRCSGGPVCAGAPVTTKKIKNPLEHVPRSTGRRLVFRLLCPEELAQGVQLQPARFKGEYVV